MEKPRFPRFSDLAPDLRCKGLEAAKCRHGKIEMIEALNHVLETQKQVRAQHAAYYAPATGDIPGAPFELPPAQPPSTPLVSATAPEGKDFKLFGDDGFDVFDVLDMINPLQHIPVVSTIYRRLTGDELSPGARIVGATLLGGPVGAALAMADTAVEHETGKDTGANLYAALFGDEGPIPAAGTAVAAAAPWQDPDLDAATVTTQSAGAGSVAFVAAAAPDLGALSEFTTGAGGRATLEIAAAPKAPAKTAEPTYVAAPWKNPDLEPIDASALALLAQTNNQTQAIETAAFATAAQVPAQAENVAPKANVPSNAERPMPSDAAKAQAINALAAMPTSQTTAAVAELARTDARTTSRSHMVPPAGDIPKGAGASLSRKATSAYATSMGTAKPTKAEVVAAADAHNANTTAALERSATDAQNDWMLGAMQSAMAKYEATAKLRTAANGETQNNAPGAGIAITR